MRFASRPPHPYRSGSPDPELFVIRRSQTTERITKKRLLFSSGPNGPKTLSCDDGQRGGQAPALREHRDREVSPTERIEI